MERRLMGVSGKLLKSVQAAEEILVKAAKHRLDQKGKQLAYTFDPRLPPAINVILGGRHSGWTDEKIAQELLTTPQAVKVQAGNRWRAKMAQLKARGEPTYDMPPPISSNPFSPAGYARDDAADWETLAKTVRSHAMAGERTMEPGIVASALLGRSGRGRGVTGASKTLNTLMFYARNPNARYGPEVARLADAMPGIVGGTGGFRLLGLGGLGTVGAAGALGSLYGRPEEPAYA